MIVVVSYRDDPHAALVEKALEEEGAHFCRVDLEEAPNGPEVVIQDNGWRLHDPHSRHVTTGDNLTTVWWRRAGKLPPPTGEPSSSELERTETYWAVRWLIESLPDGAFPFGHPLRLRAGENKVRQLEVARAVGFRVPATCLTNSRETLRAFARDHPWLVAKPLYATITRDEDGREFSLYASTVDRERLLAMLDEQPRTVSLFCQERVRKRLDIRALFFPDGRHFACQIDSSGLPESEVDWRPNTMTYTHSVCELPDMIRSLGERYLATFGLTSGSFDFGVTEEGEWVFFECNPNGQWLWMELKTNYPIARRFAQHLLNHHRSNLADSRACQR